MTRAMVRVGVAVVVLALVIAAWLWWPQRPVPVVAPPDQRLVGAHLDWDVDSPADFARRSGVELRVLGNFVEFPIPAGRRDDIDAFVDFAARHDAIALFTLEPLGGLDVVTAASARELAGFLHEVNEAGVPVLVRFGHEMNGSWYPWGQDPDGYVAAFRILAREVHRATDATAMLWAPNHGRGYPFEGGAWSARPGTAAFDALDTDGDGHLTAADDPYAPYYPGDRYVDWVGLTLYHWGDAYPWGPNDVPAPGTFLTQVTGAHAGPGGDESPLPNFYDLYALRRGKPMAIAETSAMFNTSAEGDEVAVKSAWLAQVFDRSTAERLEALRLVMWFEEAKPEPEVDGAMVDWRVSHHPQVSVVFRDLVADWASPQ